MIASIDLNADLGEGVGDDHAMLALVTSANIACGGHAGDAATMSAAATVAARNAVAIGAHPSFEDREGFGRRTLSVEPADLARLIDEQVGAMRTAANAAGSRVRYVKLHGALANLAAADRAVADTVAVAVAALGDDLAILAISGTEIDHAATRVGLRAYSEVFADRGYRADGQLVARGTPGALIEDHAEATDRMLSFLDTGLMPTVDGEPIPLAADSICVHGDSPNAVAMATSLRDALAAAGIELRSFGPDDHGVE